MKVYPTVDLTGDKYLNPDGYIWNDGEGSHERAVSQVTSISAHHDAANRPHDYDSAARYHTEAAEHYQRLGLGLQYHYKIDNVGTIFHIRPLTIWLNVVGSAANVTTLAICLDGDFETGQQMPTQEQFEALKQLLDDLCTQHPEFPAAQQNVFGHRHFSATDCPGENLVGFVDSYRNTGGNVAIPQVGYDWPSMQPLTVPPIQPIVPLPTALHPALAPAGTTVAVTAYWRIKTREGVQLAAYSSLENALNGWHERGDNQDDRVIDPSGVDITPAPPVTPAPTEGHGSSATPTPEPASVPALEPMVVGNSAPPATPASSQPGTGAVSIEITTLNGYATLEEPRNIWDLVTKKPVGLALPKQLQIAGSAYVDNRMFLLTPNMVEAAQGGTYHGILAADFAPQTQVSTTTPNKTSFFSWLGRLFH